MDRHVMILLSDFSGYINNLNSLIETMDNIVEEWAEIKINKPIMECKIWT